MNWSNTQLAELNYFCNSTRSRVPRHFHCYALSDQIKTIIDFFFYYSIMEFQVKDIKDFFKTFRISKPRSDGLRNPSPRQIVQALDRMKNVQRAGEDRYQILSPSDWFLAPYADELRYGYEKGYVQYFMEEHTC